jgi:hypothetical protein
MSDAPWLNCPECGGDVLQAKRRGYYEDDGEGEYIEHRDGCRCPYCGWMWSEEDEPERCGCGALCEVRVYGPDEVAAVLVEEKA